MKENTEEFDKAETCNVLDEDRIVGLSSWQNV